MLNCRKCPIRDRCIDESINASSIKSMLYHAFENKTDTLSTWGRLQTNCLIAKYRRDETRRLEAPATAGALSKRLKQVRAQKKEKSVFDSTGRVARSNGYVGYEEINRIAVLEPEPTEKHVSTLLRPYSENNTGQADEFWLTVENSWRHIALPADGTLVVGHFDPSIGLPPDVDLAFEDRKIGCISRRHMAVSGKDGGHAVEDLGSMAGTFLNNERLGFGPSPTLKPGDRITVGRIQMVYDRVPPVVRHAGLNEWARHMLMVAATGRRFYLTPDQPMIIGRSDARINFTPDLDLLPFGPIAQRVSRRHAIIVWYDGLPYIEDMGSGFGTRLRGGLLPLSDRKPLMPGDHIWLAGCVLVYDVQVKSLPLSPSAQPAEATTSASRVALPLTV